jgi:hypothetical protein
VREKLSGINNSKYSSSYGENGRSHHYKEHFTSRSGVKKV